MNTEYTCKEYFVFTRNQFDYEQPKKYHTWLRVNNPGKELHHLLGSTTGKKLSGWLVVMVSRTEHLTAEPSVNDKVYKKAVFFMINLPKAIHNLIGYIKYLENK